MKASTLPLLTSKKPLVAGSLPSSTAKRFNAASGTGTEEEEFLLFLLLPLYDNFLLEEGVVGGVEMDEPPIEDFLLERGEVISAVGTVSSSPITVCFD